MTAGYERGRHFLRKERLPVDIALEILYALAALETVAEFALERRKNFKRHRMEAGEKGKPGGHQTS